MEKRTIMLYVVIGLIIAWANISNPHQLYWAAWAVFALLLVGNLVLSRKSKR